MQDTKSHSNWKFTFGKYKGLHLEDVIKQNPSYVRWCVRNIEWFELPEGVKLPPPKRRIIFIEDDYDWDDPYYDECGGDWDW